MTRLEANDVARFLKRCGSSPERAFFHALLRSSIPEHQLPIEYLGEPVLKLCWTEAAAYLTTQPRVEAGRADFLLVADHLNLLIEIDDPSHWTSRERAWADRVRDRENLRAGVFTIRFTNEEVERDPDRCAQHAVEIFASLASPGLPPSEVPSDDLWNLQDQDLEEL